MSKKFTPWFPADVKPVRIGVYETRFGDNPRISGFSEWAGEWSNQTSVNGGDNFFSDGAIQKKEWRGLAKAPK
jgi:hypothetical protein